jgi:hypothetical protein
MGISKWRLDRLPAYRDAFPWLSREGEVIDTTEIPASQVAKTIAAGLGRAG